jgi:hypothetical protein
MKISEITSEVETPVLAGVEIDEESFTPPRGLKTIGMLWQGSEEELVSDLLLDTIISYNLAGIEVILEVPHDAPVKHEDLLKLAGNAGFSVSAIPPAHEADVDAWCEQCKGFARALLHVPNFGGDLVPATGYISYLIAEKFSGKDALVPTDPYTVLRFLDVVPENWSDRSKEAMREAFREELGGEEGISDYLSAILKAIREGTFKYLTEKSKTQTAE